MGSDEREALVLYLSYNTQAGDVMAGTRGARKLRFKRPGTGKWGGYRVIFYYAGEDVPLRRRGRAAVSVERLYEGRPGEPFKGRAERPALHPGPHGRGLSKGS